MSLAWERECAPRQAMRHSRQVQTSLYQNASKDTYFVRPRDALRQDDLSPKHEKGKNTNRQAGAQT